MWRWRQRIFGPVRTVSCVQNFEKYSLNVQTVTQRTPNNHGCNLEILLPDIMQICFVYQTSEVHDTPVKFTAVIEKLVRRYHVNFETTENWPHWHSWKLTLKSWIMIKSVESVVQKTLINLFAGKPFSVSQPNKNLGYKISAQSSLKMFHSVAMFQFARIKTLILPIPLDFMLRLQLKCLTVKVGFKGVTVCCKSEYLFTC